MLTSNSTGASIALIMDASSSAACSRNLRLLRNFYITTTVARDRFGFKVKINFADFNCDHAMQPLWTAIDKRWKRNCVSRGSLVTSEIPLLKSWTNSISCVFQDPPVSTAIGTNMREVARCAYYDILLFAAVSIIIINDNLFQEHRDCRDRYTLA